MGVKCLAQGYDTMSLARARTRSTRSRDEHTIHEATHLHKQGHMYSINFLTDRTICAHCSLPLTGGTGTLGWFILLICMGWPVHEKKFSSAEVINI